MPYRVPFDTKLNHNSEISRVGAVNPLLLFIYLLTYLTQTVAPPEGVIANQFAAPSREVLMNSTFSSVKHIHCSMRKVISSGTTQYRKEII